MRRWLIAGAVVAVVVAGILVAAVANLSRWVAANHDWLAAQAEKELGRPVQFGAVGVSLWGGVGVRVANLRIADDPDYAAGEFLRAASAQVTVRILPALFGRYEVRRVILREPVVTLIRDANGFNIDSLGRRHGPRKDRQRPANAEPPPPRRLPLIVVGLLDLRDGEVHLVDRRVEPPAEMAVHELTLEAEDVGAATPVAFTLAARLADATERNLDVHGTVGPIGDPPAFEALPVDVTLSLQNADVTTLLRTSPELAALMPPKLRVGGPVSVNAHAAGTAASLVLDGTIDAGAATAAWGDDFAKPAARPCMVTVTGRRDGETLSFERATVALAGATVDASGRVTPGDPLTVDLTVDAIAADLSQVATSVPDVAGVSGGAEAHVRVHGPIGGDRLPAIAGNLALRDVAVRRADAPVGITGLTTTIALAGDDAVMPPSRFLVDGQPIEASFTLRDFHAPSGELHVRGDAVPLTVVGTLPVKGLPPDVVRGITVDAQGRLVDGVPDGQATLRSTGGTVHGAEYTNLSAQVRFRDDVATLEAFALEAYGGTVHGSGSADVHDSERPRLAVEMTARGIGVDGLIASQKPKDMQRVSGRLDADGSLAATGRSWEALQRSVSGTGRVEVRDGVIHDVNIGDDILGAVTIPGIASLVPEKLRTKRPDLFSTGDTRFDLLRASAVIGHETAKTDDFVLTAKAFTVRGAGSLTVDGRIDFAGTFIAAKGLTADVVASIREAKFLTNDGGLIDIPFLLRGKLPKVRAQPDLRIVTQALQNGILEKGLDAVLDDKKRKHTEDQIKRGLDRLFGH